MNAREGGDMAGASKFAFRSKEDPRYTDRRMQNLIRKIDENFERFDKSGVCNIRKIISALNFLYSIQHCATSFSRRLSPQEIYKFHC